MNKAYIVTYIETDDTCDGYPRVFGRTYRTKDEAYAEMEADAAAYDEIVEQNDDGIIARRHGTECVWAVREVEIEED